MDMLLVVRVEFRVIVGIVCIEIARQG